MAPVAGRAPDVVDRGRGGLHPYAELGDDGFREIGAGVPQAGLVQGRGQEELRIRGAPRRRRRRADAGADGPVPRVQVDAERRHGDHHRVAGADLAELLRPGRLRDQDRRDQFVFGKGVALHAGVEVGDWDRADPAHGRDLDLGPGREQRRMAVARGRRGAEVAADRAPVANLRRAHRPGRHGQPGQPVTEFADDPCVADPGAEPDPAGFGGPSRQVGDPGQVEHGGRAAGVEVDLHHHVGAPGDRHRLWPRSLRGQGVVPARRLQKIHASLPNLQDRLWGRIFGR